MNTFNNSLITTRTTAGLSAALKEAADNHHAAEKRLPPHDWNDWYAAFIKARESRSADWPGRNVTEAAAIADRSVLLKIAIRVTNDERKLQAADAEALRVY
jgi:hypothetical protein